MEETPKKSFRNVARRYGATLDNINATRTTNKAPRKTGKKRSKRKK